MRKRIEHRVSSPPDSGFPRQGSAWDLAPFRDERGGVRIGLAGVGGWFQLQPEEHERALSVLFGVATRAQLVSSDYWESRGLGAGADYTELTGRLVDALHAAQERKDAEPVVRAVEPTLAVLTALGGWSWPRASRGPNLSDLIKTGLPDLELRPFKTEIVRLPSRAWEDPDQWPVGGGVPERALHRVMPKRHAVSHSAPSLDAELVQAGWIVLLAIGHAAATDGKKRWETYVAEGRVPAERALRGEKEVLRTFEMRLPVVAPAQVRPSASVPDTGALVGHPTVGSMGTAAASMPSQRPTNAGFMRVVASAVAVGSIAIAVTLGLARVRGRDNATGAASDWTRVLAADVPALGLSSRVLAEHPRAQGLSAAATSPPREPFEIERRPVRASAIQAWQGTSQGTIDPSSAARGVSFDTAVAYCASLGARLPTEEEWETAGRLGEIVTEPGLQEWTSSPYRPNHGGPIPAWASTFVPIRGVPADPAFDRASAAPDPWAYREPMCARGECPSDAAARLAQIGFRCARSGGDR